MKYLFFLLVLLNIVFYLWETGVGKPPATHKEAARPSTQESILLLQEIQRNPNKSPPDRLAESSIPEPEQASSGTSQPSSASQQNTSGQQTTPASPQSSGGLAEITHQPGKSIQKSEACHQLGPFASLRKAQLFQKKLNSAGVSVTPTKRTTEVENGYTILYPAANTLQEAKANRAMLAEKGFADAWLVAEGENRYGISLAMTNDKTLAEAAVSRYLSQGIVAEVKPRKVLAEKWWLEINGAIDPVSLPALKNSIDTGSIKGCE